MNKQETRVVLDRLLAGHYTVSELSDDKVRPVLRYIVKTHKNNLQNLEAQFRRQNG
jgi:hypothetical protein